MSRDGYFDERVARRYDESTGPEFEQDTIHATVEFLAGLAGGGRALELAIGTGRIAVPLAARGVPVAGIDMSQAMVKRLKAKPEARHIEVAIGDFTTTRMDGRFALVYLVFNTIMNVTTQAAQVATFRNAAAHLDPGGAFAIEVGIPDLQRLPVGGKYVPFNVEPAHLGFDEYDVANQGLISHHYNFIGGRIEQLSVPFRYVWPAELDLMAEMAGMRLRERWSGWEREPFTGDSVKQVAVWELPS